MKNKTMCVGNNKEQSYLLTKTISEKTSEYIVSIFVVINFAIDNLSFLLPTHGTPLVYLDRLLSRYIICIVII
jgi:hypothetical protein